MNEFIEKLIGRLEELITDTYYKSVEGSRSAGIENNAYHNVKKIVNKLAEEYKTTYMEELIKAKRLCANDCNTDECPFGLGEGKCFLDELKAKLENKEQHNDQNLMIVESLPSLYPMMQSFEVEAIHKVVSSAKHSGGWIPCSERLPEDYTEVLGYGLDGHIYLVEIYDTKIYGKVWKQWNGGEIRLKFIDAWQPLPPDYQPKGE